MDLCGGFIYLVFSNFLFFHSPILVFGEHFLTPPLPVFYENHFSRILDIHYFTSLWGFDVDRDFRMVGLNGSKESIQTQKTRVEVRVEVKVK